MKYLNIMSHPKKEIKGEIKYLVQLNEEQKLAKKLIYDNQIVIITGRAGSGKSLVTAQTALDMLFKKKYSKIIVTRAMIEVENETMGFLPGDKDAKFAPYIEAFQENLEKCYNKEKIDELIREKKIIAGHTNFVRGKTIDDILIVEEAQNMTKGMMLAILTRLGKNGRIIINGDNAQTDRITTGKNGLSYAIELSDKIDGIERIDLKENHRSDLVGKILDYEYGK